VHLLAAVDKFRGTASAQEVAAAIGAGAEQAGWTHEGVALADGGEGFLDALGGPNRHTTVAGPLGEPVDAAWRFDGRTAVIEMAAASGLLLAGGARENDAVAASTLGTGELLVAAHDAGARRLLVGVGGSATTDGGLGALQAMEPLTRFRSREIVVACDVRTPFLEAATRFGEQKGASSAQIRLLTGRLEALASAYEQERGIDVRELVGGGAAGGLAGGLASAGARLVSGFDLVADELDLDDRIEAADLVVTGEGFLDEESFEGKVVGGVAERAAAAGVPVVAVVGQVLDGMDERIEAISLVDRFGDDAARSEVLSCIERVVEERLSRLGPAGP
jgi:glycerate 2-kinase